MRGMTSPTPAVYRRRIESFDHPDHPTWKLGRHVEHDPRSLAYQVEADGTDVSVTWDRATPILDQGQAGSCTGNAETGALGTDPFYPEMETLAATDHTVTLDEPMAVRLYSDAETIDGDGPYPPNDNGSSGLSVCKAAKNSGYISGYVHATSLAAAKTAIQSGPFIVGSNWYTGMDNPDSTGLVEATGTVRGGHEYVCRERDAENDLWWLDNSWGTGYGLAGRFCYTSATLTKLLGEQGDITQSVPLSAPAPTPTPVPTPTPAASVTKVFSASDAAALDKWAGEPHIWHLASVAAKAWKDGVTS